MSLDFKTILCPIDFSDASYCALDYGLRFAQACNGTLLMAHVLHNPTSELFHPDGYVLSFDQAKDHARDLLQNLCRERLGGYSRCEVLIDVGDPYEQLTQIASQRTVDLIVIATHGRTGLKHLVLGSVAEKIIRHAPCPVFVVRHGGG